MEIIALIILAALITIIFQLESIKRTLKARRPEGDDRSRP